MGKQWKQWQTLFFLGFKISADGDCSREIKRCLLLGRKTMTNLESTLKSRDIALPSKVYLVKASSHVWMYGCENWTTKNVECWKIDAFELWCWRLLRVPWTVGRSNQLILKEISPEYSLKGLMLKLNLQYCGHLLWRTDTLEKTLILGRIVGGQRKGWQRMSWWDGITDMMDLSLCSLRKFVIEREACVLQSMGLQIVKHGSLTQLTDKVYLCLQRI